MVRLIYQPRSALPHNESPMLVICIPPCWTFSTSLLHLNPARIIEKRCPVSYSLIPVPARLWSCDRSFRNHPRALYCLAGDKLACPLVCARKFICREPKDKKVLCSVPEPLTAKATSCRSVSCRGTKAVGQTFFYCWWCQRNSTLGVYSHGWRQ